MLFNSIEYVIFLPLFFIGYWFIFKRLKLQNIFVVIILWLVGLAFSNFNSIYYFV